MDAIVKEEKVTRRSFLGYTIAAVGAFVAATVGSATAIFAASPLLSQGRGSQETLGPANGFQVGVPKLVQFTLAQKDGWIEEDTSKSVWVVRQGDNDFNVFVARCTHLGCAYNWNADAKEFECPCHGGRYALDGRVLGGPPPRPLDVLENQVTNGKLVIKYEEFRLGVPDKVEA